VIHALTNSACSIDGNFEAHSLLIVDRSFVIAGAAPPTITNERTTMNYPTTCGYGFLYFLISSVNPSVFPSWR
jgi:hypothetical protein